MWEGSKKLFVQQAKKETSQIETIYITNEKT